MKRLLNVERDEERITCWTKEDMMKPHLSKWTCIYHCRQTLIKLVISRLFRKWITLSFIKINNKSHKQGKNVTKRILGRIMNEIRETDVRTNNTKARSRNIFSYERQWNPWIIYCLVVSFWILSSHTGKQRLPMLFLIRNIYEMLPLTFCGREFMLKRPNTR
jgi:hypothetical protein